MKCPWCVEEGERSILTPLGSFSTCMSWEPYYDEDGDYHSHDPNSSGGQYQCSRDHLFVAAHKPCSSCDWGATEAHLIVARA